MVPMILQITRSMSKHISKYIFISVITNKEKYILVGLEIKTYIRYNYKKSVSPYRPPYCIDKISPVSIIQVLSLGRRL